MASEGNMATSGISVRVALAGKPGSPVTQSVRRDFMRLGKRLKDMAESDPSTTADIISDLAGTPDPTGAGGATPGEGTPGAETVAIAVTMAGDVPSARAALFRHAAEPDVGYVGLFESDGDADAVVALFDKVEDVARREGMVRLAGPVDGTIWERYRYKVAGFDEPTYVGDVDNPRDYPSLWEQAGFSVTDAWHSSVIPVPKVVPGDKMERRLERAVGLGYEFRSVVADMLEPDLAEIHRLVSDLYSDFPGYTPLDVGEFLWRMRLVALLLDEAGTVMATKDGKAVGFLVALPDVAGGKQTVRAGEDSSSPSRYVLLYMGVTRGHEGLGAAMMAVMRRRAAEMGAEGIAALIHEGKASGAYLRSLGARRAWSYALYGKEL